MKVTCTSLLWDGDRYGFPWREVFAEVLYHGQQVVVVSPECEDPCYVDLRRWARIEPNLKVIDSEHLGDDIHKHGPAVMQAIEEAADGDFVFHAGADELIEMKPLLEWLPRYEQELLRHPCGIEMERWDFSYSSRLITDLFRPALMRTIRGVARKWCGNPAVLTAGAGRFKGFKGKKLSYPEPVWHYYGLLSEEDNADKTHRLMLSDEKLAGAVVPREDPMWTSCRWKTNPKLSPPRPLRRSHPKIMWPWLSKSEMFWKDD